MSKPYLKLVLNLWDINEKFATTLDQILTPEHTAVIDQSLEQLPKKDGGRMILVIERYYGIRQDKATLAQIGEDLLQPVSRDRVRQIKEKGLYLMRTNPTLQPLTQLLLEIGVQGHLLEVTASLPSPALMDSLQELVAANKQFAGTFLFDHFPECSREEPCPTCRAQDLLRTHMLLQSMQDLAKEWQGGPSNDWRAIPISTLGLSVRASMCLQNDQIYTLGELIKKDRKTLMRIPNFGRKCMLELEQHLQVLGLELKQ